MFNRFCFGALLLAGMMFPLASCGGGPSLTSIVISPVNVSVSLAPSGVPQGNNQFTAIGYYTHPNHPAATKNITAQVTWASSATQVATISSTGLATATGFTAAGAWSGNTYITASAPGFNGTVVSNAATFTVTPCTSCVSASTDIVSVSVIPAVQTVATLNVPIQYEAIGTDASGGTHALGNFAGLSWVSSVSSVATIDATSGLATTAGAGITSITAIFKNPDQTAAEGSASLTVAPTGSPEPLTAMTVAPSAQTALAIGQTAHFLAIATTGSGTSVNLTNQPAIVGNETIKAATWTSSNPSVATVDPATGIATAVSAGASVITAVATNPNDGSIVTGAATFTVTVTTSSSSEPLTGLSIIPATQTALAVNQKVNFIAIGATGSGGSVNLTHQSATINGTTVAAAVWSSSNPSVATVDPATGIATALSAGVTAITAIATNPGDKTVVTATAVFTVTVPSQTEAYVSLAIVPASQTATAVNQTAQYIAIGTTGTGTTVDLTSQATWNSSSLAVALPTATKGQFTAVANGVAAITAEVKNPSNDGTVVTGSAVLTVNISPTTEPLLSMSILPGSESVPAGQPTQLMAFGTFSSTATTPGVQNMANVSAYTVTWYSSNPAVATVCAPPGPCTSTQGAVTGTPVIVTGLSQGTTAITAIASGNPDHSVVTTTTTFTVTGPATSAITALSIFPASQSITMPEVGQSDPTVNFVVIGTNGSGLQTAVTPVWTSSNPAVLPSGNITTANNTTTAKVIGPGTTTLTATYTNAITPTNPVSSVVTATATLTVTGPAAEPLLSLAINPGSPSVPFPTQTTQLTAIGTTSTGATVNLTNQAYTVPGIAVPNTIPAVTWTSSNPAVATVCDASTAGNLAICPGAPTPLGLVTAVGQGTTAITATTSNPDLSLVYITVPFTVTGGSAQQMTQLTIVPPALSLSATGQAGSLIALGTSGSTGLQQDVTGSTQIAWTSSNPTIATVSTALNKTQTCAFNNDTPPVNGCADDPPGLVKGVSAGSSTITAEYANSGSVVSATASVTVTATPAAEPLLSITILPTSISTGNLLGTGQYLAYGAFSTAPTELDITNGFFHTGFSSPGYPTSSCTAVFAAADQAALATTNPLTSPPDPQCAYVPVTWVSDAPFIFPINSTGSAGAPAGLVTADGSGTDDIYAVATNPDGTLVYSTAPATFNCPFVAPTYATYTYACIVNGVATNCTATDYNQIVDVGSCNDLTIAPELVSTLTVYGTGLNTSSLPANWLITASSATGTPNVIHCGGSTEQAQPGGSVCEASYPNTTNGNPTTVTLTAPAEPGVNFGGWSDNCVPVGLVTKAGPNSCTVTLGTGNSSNASVVGIFN